MEFIKHTHAKAIEDAALLVKKTPNKLILKLKAIAALKNNTIKNVGEVFGVCDDTIKFWVKSFAEKGIDGLESKVKNPKKSKLSDGQKKILQSWILDNPNLTIKILKKKILKEFDIEIAQSSVWFILKNSGFSHITSRPRHYKQNKEHLEEFKKKL